MFQTVTIAVRATSASCRLSPPHRSRVPRAGRSAGKEFSQIWARPLTGIGPEALVLVVRKSLDRATFRQDHRAGELVRTSLVRVACVGSCMYVHTNIHTYIHICIFLYIDIYSAILFSFGPGTKETRITLLFFLFVSVFWKKSFAIFEKWEEVGRLV